LPLSFAQQRLWFLEQLEPGSPVYNMPLAFSVHGSMQLDLLEEALRDLARRHETLRTSFGLHDGQPIQVIATEPLVPLTVVDLAGAAEEERRAAVQHLAVAETRTPFALDRGPLWRVVVVRAGAGEQVLLVTLHHAIADAWSLGLFVRD